MGRITGIHLDMSKHFKIHVSMTDESMILNCLMNECNRSDLSIYLAKFGAGRLRSGVCWLVSNNGERYLLDATFRLLDNGTFDTVFLSLFLF